MRYIRHELFAGPVELPRRRNETRCSARVARSRKRRFFAVGTHCCDWVDRAAAFKADDGRVWKIKQTALRELAASVATVT